MTVMKLSEMITEDLVLTDLQGRNVAGVLKEFADGVCNSGVFANSKLLFERLYEREQQESTGIGNGIAIPHCKLEDLNKAILSVGYSREGVDFRALDNQPTFYFFVVISPASSSVLHLRALAALSRLLRSPHFMGELRQMPAKAELIRLIRQEEEVAKAM